VQQVEVHNRQRGGRISGARNAQAIAASWNRKSMIRSCGSHYPPEETTENVKLAAHFTSLPQRGVRKPTARKARATTWAVKGSTLTLGQIRRVGSSAQGFSSLLLTFPAWHYHTGV